MLAEAGEASTASKRLHNSAQASSSYAPPGCPRTTETHVHNPLLPDPTYSFSNSHLLLCSSSSYSLANNPPHLPATITQTRFVRPSPRLAPLSPKSADHQSNTCISPPECFSRRIQQPFALEFRRLNQHLTPHSFSSPE